MNVAVYACLAEVIAQRGEAWVIRALSDAAKAQLTDIHLSCAVEQRIAERAEPWEQTAATLAAVNLS